MGKLSKDKFIENFNDLYNLKCSNYPNEPSILPAVKRIIVIGDIHGDMDKLMSCLRIAKLINNKGKWIGRDTVVVQVGDQIDSCRFNGINDCNDPSYMIDDKPNDVNILYFMTKLHNMAQKHGGAVYSLMGNHELMNVMGDMSYVSYQNIKMFENYNTSKGIMLDGLTARKHEFSPGNNIANFLACTRKIALVIGSNLFVHAGIIPHIAQKYKIDDMNKLLTMFLLKELEQPEIFTDLFTNGKTSPLWTRIYGSTINNCNELLQPLKNIYKVDRIYIGHTPQLKTGISSQCNNSVWMTDVGMSKAFDNISNTPHRNAQVLEIINDGEQFNILV